MKDLTRSYVNISPKGQKKFTVFSQGYWRGQPAWDKLTMVLEILGEELERKIQGDEQVGNKKQTAQTDHVRKPRTNAGFGII